MQDIHRVKVGGNGSLRIPKSVREQMGLFPGTTLLMETSDDREIRLRVVSESPELVDKEGVLVVRSEAIGDLENALMREREARMTDLLADLKL